MKSKFLNRTETFAGALLLALLLACEPAKQSSAQPKDTPPADTAKTATPAGQVRYDAQPNGSKMKMEGTSSIHDWSMESIVLGGYLEADAKFPESAITDANAAKPTVQIFMPVRSFKSNSKRMDEIMQETMKEPQHKRIEYKLIELKPKSAAGATGTLQFDAVGALTVAGKTKTNSIPVTIEKLAGNKLKVSGSTSIKMTDYGVKPPKPAIGLGLITTGDDVKLTFEWLAAQKTQ